MAIKNTTNKQLAVSIVACDGPLWMLANYAAMQAGPAAGIPAFMATALMFKGIAYAIHHKRCCTKNTNHGPSFNPSWYLITLVTAYSISFRYGAGLLVKGVEAMMGNSVDYKSPWNLFTNTTGAMIGPAIVMLTTYVVIACAKSYVFGAGAARSRDTDLENPGQPLIPTT